VIWQLCYLVAFPSVRQQHAVCFSLLLCKWLQSGNVISEDEQKTTRGQSGRECAPLASHEERTEAHFLSCRLPPGEQTFTYALLAESLSNPADDVAVLAESLAMSHPIMEREMDGCSVAGGDFVLKVPLFSVLQSRSD